MTAESAPHPDDLHDRIKRGVVGILVLSDLHLEFGEFEPPDPWTYDIVVLAGDIWNGTKGVEWATKSWTFGGKPVVYVPGNHEFYRSERTSTLAEMRQAAKGTKVHVLDRNGVEIEGVRFLGATLWTDFALDVDKGVSVDQAMLAAKAGLNDFSGWIRQRVRNPPSEPKFTPYQSAQEHALSRAWLKKQLHTARDAWGGPLVVVTHHAPSSLSMHPMYVGSRLNPCFYSELPAAFFGTAHLWIHGHVHHSFDYVHHGTRVVANPRGYLSRTGAVENKEFNGHLIVEMPVVRPPGPHDALLERLEVLHSMVHRITTEEFGRMLRSEVFEPGARVELIDDDMFDVATPTPSEEECLARLRTLLTDISKSQGLVVAEYGSIALPPSSFPMPALTVWKPELAGSRDNFLSARETMLIVEFASMPAVYLQGKLKLYATNKIAEVWVIDVTKPGIQTYREPVDDRYDQAIWHGPTNSITPLALAESSLRPDQFIAEWPRSAPQMP